MMEFTDLTSQLVVRQVNFNEFSEVGQKIGNFTFKVVVTQVNGAEIF